MSCWNAASLEIESGISVLALVLLATLTPLGLKHTMQAKGKEQDERGWLSYIRSKLRL